MLIGGGYISPFWNQASMGGGSSGVTPLLDTYGDYIGAWSASNILSSTYGDLSLPPLDTYENSIGAWSVARKLRTAYTGNSIEVRESGGDTLANIGFDANGDLDEAALLAHCGANNGHVRTFYDQSLAGNDAIQYTDSRQPIIVQSGVIHKINGKPAMKFNGAAYWLDAGAINGGTKPANYTLFTVNSVIQNTGYNSVLGSSDGISAANSYAFLSVRLTPSVLTGMGDGTLYAQFQTTDKVYEVINTQYLVSTDYEDGNTSPNIYVDGGTAEAGTVTGTGATSNAGTEPTFQIGNIGGGGKEFGGNTSEIIVRNVASVSEREGLRDNINAYYATYSGGGSGYAFKVRRSSDSAVANIGFDSNGDLDEVALLAFVGSGHGFIHTLYDQSGLGNDAVQTTAANQPRIVLSGVVEKVNGKPAMYFDGVNDFLDCGTINGGTKPSDFSMYAVFDQTDVPADSTRGMFGSVNNASDVDSSWGITLALTSNLINSEYGDGVSSRQVITTSNPIIAGTQTIISQTYASGTILNSTYINGGGLEPRTSLSGSATSTSGTEYKYSIGRRGEFNGSYWKGHFQELTVRNIEGEVDREGIRDNINARFNTY
jgi:hypothetical protein